VYFLQSELRLEKKLFVIRELDNKRTVEYFLQPLGLDVKLKQRCCITSNTCIRAYLSHQEGNEMTEMKSFTRGTTSGVEVKLFPGLIKVENLTEVAVREENSASKEAMGFLAREPLHSLDEHWIDFLTTELNDQSIVVNGSITLHSPWIYDLFLGSDRLSTTTRSLSCAKYRL
jgi:hypothetical protein